MKKFVIVLGIVTFTLFTSHASPIMSQSTDQHTFGIIDGTKKPYHERKAHKKLRKKSKQRKVWY